MGNVEGKGDRIVVFGAGDHAKIVLATIEAQSRYLVAGLLDDDSAKHGTAWYGYRVLGGREQLAQLRHNGTTHAVVAIGDNRRRAEVARLLAGAGFHLAQVIDPTATLLRGCRIGQGTVVLINALVGANAIVGD